MKTRLNTFDHFLKTCVNKSPFSFYGVNTLPDHPANFWGKGEYYISDLYLEFAQDGGNNGPYAIYIPVQVWIPDSLGDIEFDELNDFRDEIELITFYDEELEVETHKTDPNDHDFEIAIYQKGK